MPFDFRLNQALPWVMQSFKHGLAADNMGSDNNLHQMRVRIRAFEIVLEMFSDVLESTDEILVQPADYVVFTAYILKEFLEFKSNG